MPITEFSEIEEWMDVPVGTTFGDEIYCYDCYTHKFKESENKYCKGCPGENDDAQCTWDGNKKECPRGGFITFEQSLKKYYICDCCHSIITGAFFRPNMKYPCDCPKIMYEIHILNKTTEDGTGHF
jgi:hypothetical protein